MGRVLPAHRRRHFLGEIPSLQQFRPDLRVREAQILALAPDIFRRETPAHQAQLRPVPQRPFADDHHANAVQQTDGIGDIVIIAREPGDALGRQRARDGLPPDLVGLDLVSFQRADQHLGRNRQGHELIDLVVPHPTDRLLDRLTAFALVVIGAVGHLQHAGRDGGIQPDQLDHLVERGIPVLQQPF